MYTDAPDSASRGWSGCRAGERMRLARYSVNDWLGLPAVRQQFLDAIGGLGGWSLEGIFEVAMGTAAVKLGGWHQAHDDGSALTGAIVSANLPGLNAIFSGP
jgi:hypothetical protein